jgi:hypothetical protein
MIRNKVVARFRDGKTVKGFTFDFTPNKSAFHVVAPDDSKQVEEVQTADLKALFFVKSFDGDRARAKSREATEQAAQKLPGLKIKVTFHDQEVLVGTTNGYSKGRPGFFVVPADRASNSDRAFVLAGSAESVDTWR